MSLGMSRSITASTDPMMPSGTTSITDSGIDQLSYSPASSRKTNRMLNPNRSGACEPEVISSSDWPVHSNPKPSGSSDASRSISAMAAPEEYPGAGWPDSLTDG